MRPLESDEGQGILMTSLFDHVKVIAERLIEFRFNHDAAPFAFELKEVLMK